MEPSRCLYKCQMHKCQVDKCQMQEMMVVCFKHFLLLMVIEPFRDFLR